MTEISDEKIEEFLKEDAEADMVKDKIDQSVDTHLNEMAFLWKTTNDKIVADNTCFKCKQHLFDNTTTGEKQIHLIVPTNVDKGVSAFVSVCEKCYKEITEEESKEQPKEESK